MKFGRGIAFKLVGPFAAVTALTCLLMAKVATTKLEEGLASAFATRGEAIARALALEAEQSLDSAIPVQMGIDSSKTISAVAYIYVLEADGSVLAHTFSPAFPAGLEKKNALDLALLSASRPVQIDPALDWTWASGRIRAIDVAAPISGGALGVVHVGLDRNDIDRQARLLQEKMALWGALVALFAIGLGALTAAVVVIRPVRALIKATQVIAQTGDLTQPIEIRSGDELGQLAESFSTMVSRLREALDKLLTANAALATLMVQLRGSAEEQSRNATQQAAALQETHVTAQEIRQTSQLAAEKADRVLREAARGDAVSRKGEEAIGRSVQGLTAIREQVDEIARRIDELSSRAQQIAGITSTVKDLADQSNMLALNAAIEAVRSGEHGKGFAVVAREIRALADQSIAATRRVGEVLSDIGASIRQVVAITQAGAQRIESGIEEVRASGQNLAELSAIVKENSASARQIAAAVGQQNAGIAQIFAAMGDLQGMMTQTMRSVEATSAAARQLGDVSAGAADAVKGYRV